MERRVPRLANSAGHRRLLSFRELVLRWDRFRVQPLADPMEPPPSVVTRRDNGTEGTPAHLGLSSRPEDSLPAWLIGRTSLCQTGLPPTAVPGFDPLHNYGPVLRRPEWLCNLSTDLARCRFESCPEGLRSLFEASMARYLRSQIGQKLRRERDSRLLQNRAPRFRPLTQRQQCRPVASPLQGESRDPLPALPKFPPNSP
jgi:hypothetical protein